MSSSIKLILLSFCFCTLFCNNAFSQRVLIDAPSIYFISHELVSPGIDAGLGVDAGFGIGNKFLMAKAALAFDVTSDLGGNIGEFLEWTPMFKTELGAGLWRSHFSQNADAQNMVFTILPKAGILYLFSTSGNSDPDFYRDAFNAYTGFELAISKPRENKFQHEFFFDNGYMFNKGILFARLGFRLFFEL